MKACMKQFAVAMVLVSALSVSAKQKPNVVVVLMDDVSRDDISVYSSTLAKTPEMERIAEAGTTFETCWAPPMCFPSRAALMTGKHPYQTKIYHNAFRPYPGEPHYFPHEKHVTLPYLFKKAGYKTYVSGKWHMPGNIPHKHTTEVGFDEYCVHVHDEGSIPRDQEFDGFVETEKDMWPGRVSVFWHPGLMFNGKMIDTTIDDYGPGRVALSSLCRFPSATKTVNGPGSARRRARSIRSNMPTT